MNWHIYTWRKWFEKCLKYYVRIKWNNPLKYYWYELFIYYAKSNQTHSYASHLACSLNLFYMLSSPIRDCAVCTLEWSYDSNNTWWICEWIFFDMTKTNILLLKCVLLHYSHFKWSTYQNVRHAKRTSTFSTNTHSLKECMEYDCPKKPCHLQTHENANDYLFSHSLKAINV